MKKLIILLIFSISISTIFADLNKLRIVDNAEQTNDIVPARYQTVNRERAACIIFITDLEVDLDFRPRLDLVALTNPAAGQFHVYIDPNERAIDVHALGYEPLIAVLSDYGIRRLRSGDVYRIRLTGDRQRAVIENLNIVIQTNPANTDIYYNEQKVDNPRRVLSPVGKNTVRIEMEGYHTLEQEIEVDEQNNFFEFDLQIKLNVPVVITSTPVGADIIVDGKSYGKTPAQFFHPEGVFDILIKGFDEYSDISERAEFKHPQFSKTYRLNAERGTVSVSVLPVDSNIMLTSDSGTNLSHTGSNVFRNIMTGNYQLQVSAPGYENHEENFRLEKDRTINKQISLKELVVGIPAVTIETDKRVDFSLSAEDRQKKATFWSTNKWIGLGTSLAVLGAGYYFDMQGQSFVDDYNKTNDYNESYKAFQDSEKAFDNRDMCFYVSVVPLAYTTFSWYKQLSYRSKK